MTLEAISDCLSPGYHTRQMDKTFRRVFGRSESPRCAWRPHRFVPLAGEDFSRLVNPLNAYPATGYA